MTKDDRYDSLYQYYASLHDELDWLFLKAQGKAESNFDPMAESAVHAKGLAQFMDKTWEEWRDGTPGIQDIPPGMNLTSMDPFNPEAAIMAQAALMAWLLRYYHSDKQFALAAYNWGCGNVNKLRGNSNGEFDLFKAHMPTETQGYVDRIMQFYQTYTS